MNGRRILFWKDLWLPHFDALEGYAVDTLPQEALTWKVSDCVTASGTWDWPKFAHLLPQNALQAKHGVHVTSAGHDDYPVWRWSSSGVFSLKTAYNQIAGRKVTINNTLCKHIWKLRVPQRCRVFLWLCTQGRLFTNLSRSKLGLHPTRECDLCEGKQETVLHVLRDCQQSMQVWQAILPHEWRNKFFAGSDLSAWLTWCTCSHFQVHGYDFRLGFPIVCWNLWLSRNGRIFSDLCWSVETLIARTQACLSWGNQNPLQQRTGMYLQPIWKPPPLDMVKINVDGSRHLDSTLSTCGGVFRDPNETFMQGFMYKVGRGSIITAEAWGLLWALKLAWDSNLRHLIVECDCTELISLVHSHIPSEHPDHSVLTEIQQMMGRNWEVEVVVCSRDLNTVADALAAQARDMGVDFATFCSPPDPIRDILQREAIQRQALVGAN